MKVVEKQTYLFGKQKENMERGSAKLVTSDVLYDKSLGYGFVTEGCKRSQKALTIPECNSGFDAAYWCADEDIIQIEDGEQFCYVDSEKIVNQIWNENSCPGEIRRIPLLFRADVEEAGNYRVTLTIKGGKGNCEIFLGRRRLYDFCDSREDITKSYIVNVCEIIPRGYTEVVSDFNVSVGILGERPALCKVEIEKVDCPTIYILGDSTVTDQFTEYPYAPGTSYSGWGQMLPAYIQGEIAVSNHAHSGLTTESNREEGHYDIVCEHIRPGDYCMIQFGHNDQKLDHLKAEGGYRDNLLRYVNEIRAKQAEPIIVTPVARNSWKGIDGSYNDLLSEYADLCRAIGKEQEVIVCDLHKHSKEFVLEQGLTNAKAWFFPGDFTHSNDYGAYRMAGYVVRELMDQKQRDTEVTRRLSECLVKQSREWEPYKDIQKMTIPKQYANKRNPNEEAGLFDNLERPNDVITRVEALDMVIKACRFFPTNVYNDMFVDVVGHEWYAGTVECAYQNGIIMDEMVEDHYFMPEKKVTIEDFLCFIMNGYQSRKELPKAVTSPYDAVAMPYALPYVRAAFALDVVGTHINLNAAIRRKQAAEICIKLDI